MSQNYKVVVLGGGNSSGYAAQEWVKRGGPKGELAIITEEPTVAYERPALSKAYLFPTGFARLPGFHTCVGGGGAKQEPSFYEEHGITYLTNTTVTNVDVKGKTLTTAKGDTIGWEKLVIATGARPIDLGVDFKTPGADLEGLFYLRNVVDADKLLKAVDEVKAKNGKVVVIGGGYIGMEVAAGVSMHGVDVTMVFPESRLMERFFTPEIAAFYHKYYEAKGIKIMPGNLATAFEGKDGVVTTTVLKSGERLPSDLVVVGVGAKPNVELIGDQVEQLKDRPGGIKVNGQMQTSNPDVYAIGDVAAFALQRYDGLVTRQEHVTNARQTGAKAIASILTNGDVEDYNYLPFFYSRIFDLSWQFYGSNTGEVVHFGKDKPAAFWVKDGKIVGGFVEGGSPEDNAALKKIADLQPPAPPSEELAYLGLGLADRL